MMGSGCQRQDGRAQQGGAGSWSSGMQWRLAWGSSAARRSLAPHLRRSLARHLWRVAVGHVQVRLRGGRGGDGADGSRASLTLRRPLPQAGSTPRLHAGQRSWEQAGPPPCTPPTCSSWLAASPSSSPPPPLITAHGSACPTGCPAAASVARFWVHSRRSAWQMVTRRSARFSNAPASGLAYSLGARGGEGQQHPGKPHPGDSAAVQASRHV